MATSLTTEEYFNGTGSQTNFDFKFPYLQQADVKVEHPIGTVLTAKTSSAANDYEILNGTTIKFTTAPANGTANVKIYRATDVDSAHAVFAAGSSIRAQDLNSNFEQFLFSKQDKIDNRDITNEAIKNKHISTKAEIEVSKLKDGTARQVIQTAANGNDVEWTSNIDIPGTLDVTGATNLDSTLEVAGATGINGDFNVNTNKFTVAASSGDTVIAGNLDVTGQFDVTGTSNYTGQQTVPGGALVKDIRVGLDGNNEVSTASGSLILDSASGTVQITDHFNVTGNADIDTNLNVDGTLTVDGTSTLTGNVSVGGLVDGRNIADDGTKLDGIDAGAKDDQTSTEIKALLASDNLTAAHLGPNSVDSSEITDNAVTYAKMQDTSATNRVLGRIATGGGNIEELTGANVRTIINVEDGATADQTDAEIKTAYENNANTNALTDAEKAVIDGVTATTAELNILDGVTADKDELNLLDGKSIVTTIGAAATDAQLPTAQAVNERIDTLQDSFGGFVAISSRTTFPNTHPGPNNEADVVVSIADAVGIRVDSSGVATTANGQCTTVGGTAVKISGFPNTLRGGVSGNANPHVLGSGQGLQVVTTTTLNEYTYHKILANEAGVQNAQQAVDDFNNRYQVSANEPTTQPDGTALEEGDLWYNTNSDKMQVFDTTLNDYKDIVSVGEFDVLGLRNSANNGAAVFNGTQSQFTLVELDANGDVTGTAVAPEHPAQLVVSLFGIVQEAHEGTAIGTNIGYCINGTQIIFSQNLAAEPTFIHKIGTSVDIGIPADNSVDSAKIVNGSIVNVDVSNSAAIATSKISGAVTSIASHGLAASATTDTTNASNISSGTLAAARVATLNQNTTGSSASCTGNAATATVLATARTINGVSFNGSANITVADATKMPLAGGTFTGDVTIIDSEELRIGTSSDLTISHNGTNSIIDNNTNDLIIRCDSDDLKLLAEDDILLRDNDDSTNFIHCKNGGAVELFHNGTKTFETESNGIRITGPEGGDAWIKLYGDEGDNNSDKYRLRTTDSAGFTIDSFINGSSWETLIKATGNNKVELRYDNSLKFETTTDGIKVNGIIKWDSSNSGRAIELQDNQKIFLGNSNDLKIFHNGSDSFVSHVLGSGHMRVAGDSLKLMSNTSDENYLVASKDGSVELYHANTKTFETAANGARVVASEGNYAYLYIDADEGDDNADKWRWEVGNPGHKLSNKASGSWESSIDCTGDGTVKLYYDGSKKFETTSAGAKVSGNQIITGSGGNTTHLQINNGTDTDGVKLLYSSGSNIASMQVLQSGSGFSISCGGANAGNRRFQAYSDTSSTVLPYGDENMGKFDPNGAVSLYWDNVKKFETVSGGAKVTGDLEVTGSLTGVTTGPTVMACWDNSGTYSTKMSSGVSSITDQATGESRINFSSNFTDVNYVAAGSHDGSHTNNGGDSRLPGFTINNDKNVAYADLHFWSMHTNVNASYHAEYNDCFAAFWR